jgi:hypothetical protein
MRKANHFARRTVLRCSTGFSVALSLGSIAGCKPTQADVQPLVDERLTELGLMPKQGALDGGGDSTRRDGATAEPPDPVLASLVFLGKLDKLMEGFRPSFSVDSDSTDALRCVTSDALQTDPQLRMASEALKRKRDDGEKKRAQAAKEFYRTTFPVSFRIDYDWKTHMTPAVPATFACHMVDEWNDMFIQVDGHAECDAVEARSTNGTRTAWEQVAGGRPSAYTYSGTSTPPTEPPELMRRMTASGLEPLPRFSCRVRDVAADKDRKRVTCLSFSSPAPLLRISGALPSLHVGDVVSVPLATVRRDPDGVLLQLDVPVERQTVATWVVDADSTSLTVDHAASCPSSDEVLAASKSAK